LRIFDSGFENGVAELLAGDSKFGSAVAEFDISDSADDAVAAGGMATARSCARDI
jgi:hypothetical protein